MAEAPKAKSEVVSPRSTQAENLKALGGQPPILGAPEVMKKNMPSARKAAPDSFRPATK